ncbi:hypothetical protein [Microbacterium sp. No. 7]|uniref:hypothetical protein n=1 Tax=Microbacterium sp. No. 7 TaxID=1714373 RepID=UPI0006ECE807|nr:hypothetical protein [Microbacterium sp. No. 7]ALJ21734.1 hypothetical protein AOA12_18285 [Microbacterium sp. No. 7]
MGTKTGIVVGLAAGYVLGTRAGRERYVQIRTAWLKLWNAAPVQKQVDRAKGVARDAAVAIPSLVWDSAVKATRAATASKTADAPAKGAPASGIPATTDGTPVPPADTTATD